MTCDVTMHTQHGTPFTNREVSRDITDSDRPPRAITMACPSDLPSFIHINIGIIVITDNFLRSGM